MLDRVMRAIAAALMVALTAGAASANPEEPRYSPSPEFQPAPAAPPPSIPPERARRDGGIAMMTIGGVSVGVGAGLLVWTLVDVLGRVFCGLSENPDEEPCPTRTIPTVISVSMATLVGGGATFGGGVALWLSGRRALKPRAPIYLQPTLYPGGTGMRLSLSF